MNKKCWFIAWIESINKLFRNVPEVEICEFKIKDFERKR